MNALIQGLLWGVIVFSLFGMAVSFHIAEVLSVIACSLVLYLFRGEDNE